jgi:inosine-uridine nucleoside N-ribohydrolase
MKLHEKLSLVLVFLMLVSGFAWSAQPVKVIFDSDMGPDFDDVGAITVLHALAAKGECEILATVASDGYPYIAPTLEVFNRYFGKPEILVGAPGSSAPTLSCPNHWNDSLVVKYLPRMKTNADYPSATEVYRRVLSKQPDKSVVIVTVGFLSNLADLLKSGPDKNSSLSGKDLVAQKVKKWVAMAGAFPEGSEFNVNQHPDASEYVVKNWPSPVLFSGFEIGVKIMTGSKVAVSGSKNSPVHWAYKYCLETYDKKPIMTRNSWDHTAVLCAVRNPEDYFYVIKDGTFVCNPDGSNGWNPDKNSNHSFLVHKYPYQKIAAILDDLMLYEPKGK